jgi:hypothetical protein
LAEKNAPNADVCDKVAFELYMECYADKNALEVLQGTGEGSKPFMASSDRGKMIGIVLVSIAFVFFILLIFFNYYKHVFFEKTHADLMRYVRQGLRERKSDEKIASELRKVGWREKDVKEALRDAKKKP